MAITEPQSSVDKIASTIRPPVVVVLGHVDHGKTSLLDFIRKTKVAAKESGGITQHIGAYQAAHGDRKITFIDTPGHEAFSQMRSRGVRVADIAVLVVAADDGVKPQTLESLDVIRNAGIPYVVVLNKIDKPDIQADRVKAQLAEAGVLLEGWGGDVPNVALSAKSGQGVPELLELIALLADLAELKADAHAPVRGVVIESHRDPRRGVAATLLIKDGTLRLGGEVFVAGGGRAKIRLMEDFAGARVAEAGPAVPVRVLGFTEPPPVGAEFFAGEEASSRGMPAVAADRRTGFEIGGEATAATLPLIVKADVRGSLEAVEQVLRNLPLQTIGLEIHAFDVGEITENDVKLAVTSGARIVGFRVRAPGPITRLAGQLNVTIKTTDVIYDLADLVKGFMRELLGHEMLRTDLGSVVVLAKFKFDGRRMVVGGRVQNGFVAKGAFVDIVRGEKRAGGGKLVELQQSQVPVDKVEQGNECGMLVEGDVPIGVGDTLRFYGEEKKARELE